MSRASKSAPVSRPLKSARRCLSSSESGVLMRSHLFAGGSAHPGARAMQQRFHCSTGYRQHISYLLVGFLFPAELHDASPLLRCALTDETLVRSTVDDV